MAQVLVSGSIAYDRIMDFPGLFKDHFLPDKLHNINVSFQVDALADNFGGCAGNIAYNLSLLGVESSILATAGSDFERYRAYLRNLLTDPNSVHIEKDGLTSSAYVMTDKADNQIAAFSMGAGKVPYTPLPATDSASCAVIAAGCPDDMRALPAYYRSEEVPFFFDPGQAMTALSAEDIKDGLNGAEAVFGNDYEFDLIMQRTGMNEHALLEKARVLIVTYGEKGSRVVTQEGEKRIGAVQVKEAVDPTGAGDAYRAGYIAAYLKTLPPETCAKFGSSVAAYAVEKYGTQNHSFTPEELQKRYEEAYGENFPL
jgi:adenosine kinase